MSDILKIRLETAETKQDSIDTIRNWITEVANNSRHYNDKGLNQKMIADAWSTTNPNQTVATLEYAENAHNDICRENTIISAAIAGSALPVGFMMRTLLPKHLIGIREWGSACLFSGLVMASLSIYNYLRIQHKVSSTS